MSSDRRPVIACVGQTNVDHVFEVGTVIRTGEKHHASGASVRLGGGAANQAMTVARLGGRALLVSRLGDDAPATTALMELRHADVDVSLVEQLHHAQSATSAVVVGPSGDRTIIGYADPALYFGRPPELPYVDAVVTDARWGSAMMSALRRAHALGVPSVVDIDERVPPARVAEANRIATHVVYAAQGLMCHAPARDLTESLRIAQRRTDAFVAVTCGADGVMWIERDELRTATPPVVDAVDTTGAGDVFHAALAVALAEQRPVAEAIDVAMVTAALMCAHPAGRGGIPTRSEVDAVMTATDSRVAS